VAGGTIATLLGCLGFLVSRLPLLRFVIQPASNEFVRSMNRLQILLWGDTLMALVVAFDPIERALHVCRHLTYDREASGVGLTAIRSAQQPDSIALLEFMRCHDYPRICFGLRRGAYSSASLGREVRRLATSQ
jgi:hypothetical protein